MPVVEKIGRRSCVPIIYTRGTHYEVGFDVGRTFSGLIQNFLATYDLLNKEYLPLYETEAGRKAYQETLDCVRQNFPQYVKELQGTADGAKVPFHKLFLLHMDEILPNTTARKSNPNPNGCSTVCCNYPEKEFLGHTEDALAEILNNIYFVSAHIIADSPQGRWKVTEEKFTSLCYAGHLPGFTMSYNHHGLVYSVNIIKAKTLASGKTPRHFLTRALLAGENFARAQQILRDAGCGAGDGVSINMTFLRQEGDRLFHNAELAPAAGPGAAESVLSVLTASPHEHMFHANKYLRLKVPEVGGAIVTSSDRRQAAFMKFPVPRSKEDIEAILGDQSDREFSIFREESDDDYVKTVAVGIFDCVARTWSIYTGNPKTSEPVVVLPIQLKTESR
ncbi:beta-alanyl-dopamine/carcinine hydrolase isoform X2 [Bacillus rossius redtenbacheri]|uniref:beta-alanyl-dopamine/carcinine hydrolase isoform X2 n=1 Tax=Bacillus rossius redtenbacheri TaxID=93214 RepID=UPI002FDD3BC3